jgi:hypothetical protein
MSLNVGDFVQSAIESGGCGRVTGAGVARLQSNIEACRVGENGM